MLFHKQHACFYHTVKPQYYHQMIIISFFAHYNVADTVVSVQVKCSVKKQFSINLSINSSLKLHISSKPCSSTHNCVPPKTTTVHLLQKPYLTAGWRVDVYHIKPLAYGVLFDIWVKKRQREPSCLPELCIEMAAVFSPKQRVFPGFPLFLSFLYTFSSSSTPTPLPEEIKHKQRQNTVCLRKAQL